MERALLTGRSAPDPAALKGFAWAVAGSEFCQNRLPSAAALAALRRVKGLKISLATSVLTDAGLAAAEKLIAAAWRRRLLDEVIVNDWGLLEPLKKCRGLRLSAGRLLSVELSMTDAAWTRRFAKERGFVCAEADEKALASRLRERGFSVSWHRPHAFKAVTTYCPFEKHFKAVCAMSCEGRSLTLSNPCLKKPLLLLEKAYFSPAASAKAPAGVRRVVERPVL